MTVLELRRVSKVYGQGAAADHSHRHAADRGGRTRPPPAAQVDTTLGRIRASDADREEATARLRDHYAEGRLTYSELGERVTAALNARTFGDLRRVLADLPGPQVTADG